jgi:UDP-N-acetylmuramate-alanine ligase
MNRKVMLLSLLGIFLIGISALAQAPLKIDYQYNVQGPDSGNYFAFSGPH